LPNREKVTRSLAGPRPWLTATTHEAALALDGRPLNLPLVGWAVYFWQTSKTQVLPMMSAGVLVE
jgi:hypothetical protein